MAAAAHALGVAGAASAFRWLSNGCSWYEAHRLGGCQRLAAPRPACATAGTADADEPPTLAVVVPLRAPATVAEFCARLPPILRRLGVRHHIFAANQVDALPFNRGALVNAAFKALSDARRARRHGWPRFDYVAVHDLDRFPAEANASCAASIRGYYSFPAGAPRVLHPDSFAGGVLVLRSALYRAVNGFSNVYWGYGEEDNDLFLRLRWCGLPPRHGDAVDACMVHDDCAACRKQKRDLDKKGSADGARLRGHEERLRARIAQPRRHMLHDGLSTFNGSVVGPPRHEPCGGSTITTFDVSLAGIAGAAT